LALRVTRHRCAKRGEHTTDQVSIYLNLSAFIEELGIGISSRSIAWMQFSVNTLARERMISFPGQGPYAAQTSNMAAESGSKSLAGHDVLLPAHLRRRASVLRYTCWLALGDVEVNWVCELRETLGSATKAMSTEAAVDWTTNVSVCTVRACAELARNSLSSL